MTTPLKSEGILLLNKSCGYTSFDLVRKLRKITGISKIGHAGTLDPFASGLMVMLIGRSYTKMSHRFMSSDKAYKACVQLGKETSTFDLEGDVTSTSDYIPSLEEVKAAIQEQQGTKEQIPPMFSAKKVQGKKLYELARKGITIERKAQIVTLETTLIRYDYPELEIDITCSKGTYIRALADEIGKKLTCGAHLKSLVRTRSGHFSLDECIFLEKLEPSNWHKFLRHL